MARNYSSIATEKTLAADVSNVATQITLNNITGLPTPPYTLVLNPDTTIEEIVTVDADQSGVTAPTLRVTRAQEGTTAQVHTVGQSVKHMITARDLQDTQDHITATENVHGISDTAYLIYANTASTLTNKTMSGSANSFSNISQSAITNLVSDLAAKDTALANHEADTTSIHGIADTSLLATTTGSQTLTNKTINGSSNTLSNIAQSSVTNLTSDLAAKASTTSLTTHTSATASVHGITDTSKLFLTGSSSAGRTIFVQAAQPTANAIGDIWFQVTGL